MKNNKQSSRTTIEDEFFFNYAGSKQPYAKVWRKYCYFDECCKLFQQKDAPKLKSICILGTATGEILEGFHKKLGIIPHGCEVNAWAYQQIPSKYRRKVSLSDMQKYIREARKKGQIYNLSFSNSLLYLPQERVLPFMKNLAHVSEYVHFHSSFTKSACPDPWRRTLMPYSWWNEQFEKAGFYAVPGFKRTRTYLWRSIYLATGY